MLVARQVSNCDITGITYPEPVDGAAVVAQGATGRWCEVLWIGPEQIKAEGHTLKTYEEAVAYAEMRGGEIDF